MKLAVGLKPHGRFCIEKGSRSRQTCERMQFENIVLDVGWEHFAYRAFYTYCFPDYLFLGTGTSEPQRTDPGLEAVSQTLPGCHRTTTETDFAVRYTQGEPLLHEVTLRFDYDEGVAEGVWTELGLAYERDYTEPYNRSLFRDENGDPTSLTILSDEYLTVFVQLQLLIDTTPQTGTFQFNGETVNYTANPVTWRESTRANIFREGLARYGVYGGSGIFTPRVYLESYSDPAPASEKGVSSAFDRDALKATAEFRIDPNDSFHGLSLLGFTAEGGWNRDDGLLYVAFLDRTITKTETERLTGGWTIQYQRDESLT